MNSRYAVSETAADPLRLVTIARLAEILVDLQRSAPGVLSATIASADGLTVASTLSNSQEADRISAMSGSLSALAGALTREAGHGRPDRLILESGSGHIMTMNVAVSDRDLVLTVITNESSLLGKLLWSCNTTADLIVAACA
jgi:predicted regulator of Ras-like GTPase activity (Roadblock/LC7/MglB family)